MKTIRILSAAFAALIAGSSTALSQAWPNRPIQVVSPFSAGNANDLVARVVLDQVSKQLGQTIVFENRPGGGGTIGAASVARAKPDGYTILIHSSSFAASRVLHKKLPFDTLKDFLPVAMFGVQPSVLVCAPSKGYKTVADIVKAAKAKPGALNYASAGVGAASHMAAERFLASAGIKVQHIPFRGPIEAFTEVMAGRIDFYFLPISPALPNIQNGKLAAIAVSTPARAPSLPNVPTTKEAGYPGAAYLFWGGLFLPVKAPAAIADRLHAETTKALALSDVQARLAKLGVQPMPMTRAEFDKFFREDVTSTIKLAKEIGLMPQN
ncbi:MAG: Bug family tripartite tricarboxylate transporter substrate binding protein [Xanthobacteraceae bacterium]